MNQGRILLLLIVSAQLADLTPLGSVLEPAHFLSTAGIVTPHHDRFPATRAWLTKMSSAATLCVHGDGILA